MRKSYFIIRLYFPLLLGSSCSNTPYFPQIHFISPLPLHSKNQAFWFNLFFIYHLMSNFAKVYNKWKWEKSTISR